MPETAKFELAGGAEVAARIRALDDGMKRKVLRRLAYRMALNVKNEARSEVQALGLVKTGALLRNIAVKRQPGSNPEYAQFNVGVRHSQQRGVGTKVTTRRKGVTRTIYVNDPFYWRFLEFGAKRGNWRLEPRLFMTQAMSRTIEKNVAFAQQFVREFIEASTAGKA